jgi:DNA-nicking Smr family endonuclease
VFFRRGGGALEPLGLMKYNNRAGCQGKSNLTLRLLVTMGRMKKKRHPAPPAREREAEPFNPVPLLRMPPAAVQAAPAPVRADPPPVAAPPSEETCFQEAMEGVQPLPGRRNRVSASPDPALRPQHPAPDNLESLAYLQDLVAGQAEMDISFSDEYVEGSMPGTHPKAMRRLKRGLFPVQDYVDLHGLTQAEAEVRLRDFVLTSHRRGLRCVLVVHGRGRNSENHIPVLKERLPLWLKRGPIKHLVLAFSTARPYDGGTGALYLLLRRRGVCA